jgi:hypothetical protein
LNKGSRMIGPSKERSATRRPAAGAATAGQRRGSAAASSTRPRRVAPVRAAVTASPLAQSQSHPRRV